MNRDRSDTTGLTESKSGLVIDIEELDTSIDNMSSRNRSSENIEEIRLNSIDGNTPKDYKFKVNEKFILLLLLTLSCGGF